MQVIHLLRVYYVAVITTSDLSQYAIKCQFTHQMWHDFRELDAGKENKTLEY